MLMMAVNRHGDVFEYFITSSDALFSSLFGQLFTQAMWSPTRLQGRALSPKSGLAGQLPVRRN